MPISVTNQPTIEYLHIIYLHMNTHTAHIVFQLRGSDRYQYDYAVHIL